eukprot:6206431-Pleurochrysis_carterae.AAC.2
MSRDAASCSVRVQPSQGVKEQQKEIGACAPPLSPSSGARRPSRVVAAAPSTLHLQPSHSAQARARGARRAGAGRARHRRCAMLMAATSEVLVHVISLTTIRPGAALNMTNLSRRCEE